MSEQVNQVRVRQLGPDDWYVTRELRLAALADSPEAFGGSYDEAAQRTERDWRAWPRHGVVYAAYLNETPVGLACGWLPEKTPGVTELISMWVAPSARGRRIVGLLIDAVATWARDRGTALRLEAMADNRAARRAYARQGFTACDRPTHYVGAVALRLTPVRPATAADIPLLPEIEAAADEALSALNIRPLPPPSSSEDLAAARALLVVDDPPVGFARIDEVDGAAHLEQLSVHPDRARRGIGTVLLNAACRWAVQHRYPVMTLITFADVAFNAPFYARNGFAPVVDADLTPGLRELRRHEARLGLDALGTRVVMRKPM